MRTIENFHAYTLPKIIKSKFTDRIQEQLQKIPWPEDIPPDMECRSLYIFGEAGTGKTIYSAFLMLNYCQQQYINQKSMDCLFVSVDSLLEQLQESYSRNEYPKGLLELYKNVDLLVLDDIFGSRKPTDWVLQILYSLINYRYEYLKKTIFTSNHSLSEASKIYNDLRITSRIERMGDVVLKKDWRIK